MTAESVHPVILSCPDLREAKSFRTESQAYDLPSKQRAECSIKQDQAKSARQRIGRKQGERDPLSLTGSNLEETEFLVAQEVEGKGAAENGHRDQEILRIARQMKSARGTTACPGRRPAHVRTLAQPVPNIAAAAATAAGDVLVTRRPAPSCSRLVRVTRFWTGGRDEGCTRRHGGRRFTRHLSLR